MTLINLILKHFIIYQIIITLKVIENRWLIQCVNRKESILMKKYHLQDSQIERLQAHYWGKTNL